VDSLSAQVYLCKGDNNRKSEMLEQYKPLINRTVINKCGNMDEDILQIARIAFCEAVEKYSEIKGGFVRFAELVMVNRINDELRKRYYKIEEAIWEEEMINDVQVSEAQESFQQSQRKQECRENITEFFRELRYWGFQIDNIEKYCPKHQDTRENCIYAARILQQDEVLKEILLRNRKLPVRKLSVQTKLKVRFLEKHSKYITLLFIALNGDFNVIHEYIGGGSYNGE
jgi:RNA polymerase sigma factor